MDLFIFLVPALILFAVLLGYVRSSSTKKHPPSHWRSAEGTVFVNRGGSRLDQLGEEYFDASVECVYQVNGISYRLKVKTPNARSYRQREWENISRYYPSGYPVTVFYDPKKPSRAEIDFK
jgi:hypothetical protein